MKRWILWAPLAGFVVFFLIVVFGLVRPDDRTIPSQLVGKPLPAFNLPPSLEGRPGLSSDDFKQGQPRLLNVFASWCVPCIAEAAQLTAIEQRGVPIDAIAIRDRPEDVAAFLGRWGDPYQRIGADDESRVQIALGSSGVPETFVIDGKGIIRLQHIGEIRPENVPEILDALEKAR